MAICAIHPDLLGKLPFGAILHLLKAQYERHTQEQTYRIYTADTLKYICESVTNRLGGLCMVQRYTDFISAEKQDAAETSEDIIGRIGGKLGEMGGDGV